MFTQLRETIRALPVPGVHVIKPGEDRPTRQWLIRENRGTGFYFSSRQLDDTLYIFRLK